MSKTKQSKPCVFVVEGHYRSDRHGNLYWGPILHPLDTERYAIFAEQEEADDCVTFIEDRDLGFDVGIMGNDVPERFRVTRQVTRGPA
jgi:hypothetical protein